MKFVVMTGGLGNQMFIYAFVLSLRNKGQKGLVYKQYHDKSSKYGHQGFELNRIFNLHEHDIMLVKILRVYDFLIKVFPRSWKTFFYKLIGIHIVKVPENFIYYPSVFDFKYENELYRGTWQSEKYFFAAKDEILKSFVFRKEKLSERSKEFAKQIVKSNSVSIHVRRDDYLSPQYIYGFGGICTIDYYNNAIEYMDSCEKNIQYYIFSDDLNWVRDNLNVRNGIIVDFNRGEDSWQDMYLMSCCKHNIIANSSFSWWGAYLNRNTNKIVIAPKKWWNSFEKDDVVPENWIRI